LAALCGLKGEAMKDRKKYKSLIMRRFNSKAGSALIWALAVALILCIVLAAGMGVVQRQQNANIQQHIENQAYFSAMSVTRAILGWMNGSSSDTIETEDEYGNPIVIVGGADDRNSLINLILGKNPDPGKLDSDGFFSINDIIDPSSFPDILGDINLSARYNTSKDEILIKTTATYNGEAHSVIGRLASMSTGEYDPGGVTAAKINFPDSPDYEKMIKDSPTGIKPLANSTTSLQDPTGNYIADARTGSGNSLGSTLTGRMNILIVEGTSNFIFNGTANILIIRADATVTFGNNAACVGTLIIEDGGTTIFKSNSQMEPIAGYHQGPPDHTEVYVHPGGSFINEAQGRNQSVLRIFAFASLDKDKIAKIQINSMTVLDVLIQPTSEDYASYSPDLGNPSGLIWYTGTTNIDRVIHLPSGYRIGNTQFSNDPQELRSGWAYYTSIPNWSTIAPRVCNPVSTLPTAKNQKEAPFCPHYNPVALPEVTTTSTSWYFDGVYDRVEES